MPSSNDDDSPIKISRASQRQSKRPTAGTRTTNKSAREAALAALKTGKRNLYDEANFEPVYDEVDEEQYSEIVRQRVKGDWIVDGTC